MNNDLITINEKGNQENQEFSEGGCCGARGGCQVANLTGVKHI